MSNRFERDAVIAQVRTMLHSRKNAGPWHQVEENLVWEIERTYPSNVTLTEVQMRLVLDRFVHNTNRWAQARSLLQGNVAADWGREVEGWVRTDLVQHLFE